MPLKKRNFLHLQGSGREKNWRWFSFAVQRLLKALSILVIVILLTAVERAANFCVVADLRMGF
jgi:hypothetical protein